MSKMNLKSRLQRSPAMVVIVSAILLRLLAVIFSQGYMSHDDHFETIEIAASWHHDGMFLPDGSLRWEGKPDIGVLRSAVYNLFILGLMKITSAVGIDTLHAHMYFNRLIHALLSLLPVIYGYRYLKEETDERTALGGGLLLSCHFIMPYLGVRNLVEMVSADLLFPSLYYAHRGMKTQLTRDCIIAAILGGLAVAIRLQVVMALCAVPIAMVVQSRRWKPAIVFSAGMIVMLLIQGTFDIYTHGKFFGSSINYIVGNLGAPPTIPGPWYRYILLILGVMIPPVSLLFVASLFHKKVIKDHLIMWSAVILFVVVHSAIVNKQERFIIPVLPILMVLGCVGMFRLYQPGSWLRRHRMLVIGMVVWFAAVNVVLLAVFTFNYGKRGAVDPLVYLSEQLDAESVIFDETERNLFVPYGYWNTDRSGAITLFKNHDLDSAIADGRINRESSPKYAVIFSDTNLEQHLQAFRERIGEYELVYHSEPSIVDAIANKLNPKYNRRNESWVVRLIAEQ